MGTREAHIEAVTSLGERVSRYMVAEDSAPTQAVAVAALLLLVRSLIDALPEEALPCSMQMFRTLLPHLLHDLEPDADGPSIETHGTVQ